MRSYLIYIIAILVELLLIRLLESEFNSIYSLFFFLVLVMVNGIIAYALFNSFLTSIIAFFSFFSIYSIIFEINSFNLLQILLYYFPYYLIVSVLFLVISSFIRRNFSDFLIDELRKTRLEFSPIRLLVGVSISFIVYYFFFPNIFFLLGSVISSIPISLYGSYYEIPLVTLSWIILPYIIFPKGNIHKRGIKIGNIIGKLSRGSTLDSVMYIQSSPYKWIRVNEPYYVDFSSGKNYNTIIIGTSGAGKSTLAKKIIKMLNVSYLVFDIHGEYFSENSERIDASKVAINPLSLFGRSPRERAIEVAMMIKSLFNLGNLQTMDLANLILEAYAEKGIDENDTQTWNIQPPTFRDILLLLEKKKKVATTTQELSRYESLEPYLQFLSSTIFSNSSVNMSDILNKNYIIDFSKVPTNEIKYIIIETLLKSIQSYMYSSGVSNLKKIIVIDEAPFILSKESGKQLLERLFAEGRKFGFGFIIISQTSEYVKDLLPNTAYLFVFNLIEPKELDYASKLIGGYDSLVNSSIYETLQKLPKGICVTRDLLRGDIYLVKLDIGDSNV